MFGYWWWMILMQRLTEVIDKMPLPRMNPIEVIPILPTLPM